MRKIIITILFVTFSAIVVNAVGSTVARYSNSETYRGNFFVAASLDFTVNNKKFGNGGDDGSLHPGDSMTQFVTILNRGSLDFQYTIQVEPTDGDDGLCQVLNLEAKLKGAPVYTGNLVDFVSSPVAYSTTTDEWEFIISLPVEDKVAGHCRFDFTFSGWQTTLPEFGGFSNIEKFNDPVRSVVSITPEEATATSIVIEETVESEPETTIEVELASPISEPEPLPVEEPVVPVEPSEPIEIVDDLTSDGL